MTARVQLQKKKIFGRDPQAAWLQDEVIGGKPPVVEWLWLGLSLNGVNGRSPKTILYLWDLELKNAILKKNTSGTENPS
jgi:hypothetical protein